MITVGINYSQMHDSSACIVRDGELLFAVAEERISRVKHDAGFPKNAIRACLDFAKVRAEQLDEVCFGWQTAGPVFRHNRRKTPAAAFQTLLGLGTGRESTEYEQIRGAKDLKSQPLEAC